MPLRGLVSRRSDLISVGLILVLGSAYQLLFLREGIGLIDEGHLANAARRLVGGDVLYRDVYSVYPPASFYGVATLFDVFGASLIVVRAFHIVMTLACALASYGWARQIMSPVWAWLAGMLVAVTGWEAILERCHYGYLYCVFPVFALTLFLRWDPAVSRRWGLLAVGALAGLTLSFRLVPFVALVAALATIWLLRGGLSREGWRQVGWIAMGFSAVLIPIIAFFVAQDAGGAFFEAVFWTSFGQYVQGGEFNLPFPALQIFPSEFSRSGLHRLFLNWEFYLPIAIYAGALVEFGWGWRGVGRVSAAAGKAGFTAPVVARLSMAVFGAVLFLRATGRSDYYHLAPVLVPAYLLGVDFLGRGFVALTQRTNRDAGALGTEGVGSSAPPAPACRPGAPAYAAACAVCVVLVSGFVHDVDGATRRVLSSAGKVELGSGGPRVPAAGTLDDLVADLRRRTQEGDSIVVLPWYPVLYFLTERANPTRFDWLFPGYLDSEAEVASLIEAIDRSPVRVIVYAPSAIDGDPARSLAGFAPSIDRYVRQNFRPVKRYGLFLVMERGRPGRPGRPGRGGRGRRSATGGAVR